MFISTKIVILAKQIIFNEKTCIANVFSSFYITATEIICHQTSHTKHIQKPWN